MGKPSARITEKKREKTEIDKIRKERREVTTDTTGMQRIIRDCYEKLYAHRQDDNLEEMDKFLESCDLPKLNQEERERARPVT